VLNQAFYVWFTTSLVLIRKLAIPVAPTQVVNIKKKRFFLKNSFSSLSSAS